MTTTVQELADTYFEYFETVTKVDNRDYVVIKDLENEQVHKLLDSVHNNNDYNQSTFAMVHSALSVISECSNLNNIQLNTVTTYFDLMNWLNDNYERAEQVNEVVNSSSLEKINKNFDLFGVMEVAYTMESYEVLYSVLAYLQLEINNMPEVHTHA